MAALVMMTGTAVAQNTTPAIPDSTPTTEPVVPAGYSVHQSVDLGGHMANVTGSNSMYDTLVNLHSGPRMLGQTFEMRALPDNKHPLFDHLSAFSSGFGGDPNNFATLDVIKGKLYEFSGIFRRDRQYFDYDLLGNPGISGGYSIPISGSTTPYAWPQVMQSPFMFNTVRRMTDTNLTLLPLSKVTFRFGYSQNIFQGPSLTPSGNSVAGSEVLLQEFQRNSTDDFTGGVDWKPVQGTKLTFEEQIDHYKGDSYFTMAPGYLTVQEADGTKVSLLDSYQSFLPYGYNSTTGAFAPSSNCNASSMISSSTILYANPNGGSPIIDPACNVISSYFRSQPIREIFPSEIFRLQSSSIKNVEMNGDIRYTHANMNMPNYYESFQGLDKASREIDYAAYANARRQAIDADYGIIWQVSKTVSIAEQVSYWNVHQPGTAEFTSGTTVTVPTTAGEETINYTGLTSTTTTNTGSTFSGSAAIGTPAYEYFGQKFVINNATVMWDATARATFSLTYRYRTHSIVQDAATGPSSSVTNIDENGGIFNVALRPTSNWELSGSVEILYDDNVFTPVAPRQTQRYRIHTLYRPKPWATVSGAYNDLERHDNTNNTGTPSAVGPLDHVDHSRVVSLGADLMPNVHYGLDVNYAYSDVYTATNVCFQGAASVLPGGAIAPAAATQSGQLCSPVAAGHGAQTVLFGPARDFEDAPTQFGSVALAFSPVTKLHSDLGYRVSAVNGSRFFTDAGDVNGSMVSTYQSPFVSVAWTVHKGLIWKGEYNFYGYGEGGRSGAEYCNDNPALTVGQTGPLPVVPCSSLPNTAMSGPAYGLTAPRNFHANNVTLGLHYEF
ncbi:MAG TPA: hypothetical protein VND90_03150 [Terracidiphilus sp.]|nr:hypothetical protein [Terracidiphilus sp.]